MSHHFKLQQSPTSWVVKCVAISSVAAVLWCSAAPLHAQTLVEMNAVNSIQSGMAAGNAGTAQGNSPGNVSGGNADGGGVSAGEKQYADQILQSGWWGPGGYFSITKIILFILVFWAWVYYADWMNGDMERLKNPNRQNKNLVGVGIYLVISTVAFYIPIFWVAFPLTLIAAVTPALIYAKERNRTVQEFEKVLTRDHLLYVFANLVRPLGIKINIKQRQSYEGGAPIELAATNSTLSKQELQGRLLVARNHLGYNSLRDFIFDGIIRGADAILFDYQVQKTVVRHKIDGVWIDVVEVPRGHDAKKEGKGRLELALESVKVLVGGNPEERRAKQTGTFTTALHKKTIFDTTFTSQGTQTGERAVLEFSRQKASLKSLDELGMSTEMQQSLRNHLNSKQGFFVFASPPTGGLRTTVTLGLRFCDRFTRDVACVEDKRKPYENVENTMMSFYDSLAKETPMNVLPDIFFKEPNCVICHEMVNAEVLTLCCEEVEKERLIITSIRANDAVEAIYRLLAMKVTPQLLVSVISGVIAQRLVRKLCPDCKEEYTPTPQLLQQLRIPASAVNAPFYRVRTPLPEHEERKRGPCATCNDIGYKGRTGLFELITIDDNIRAALIAKPDPVAVRKAIDASKQPGFLQAGLAAVLQGVTSLEEVMRVMKSPT